jgi:hypothetical protein
MISEPPEYDPKTIWQSQTQYSIPSFEEIRMRAHRLMEKNRRGAVIFAAALILYLALSVGEDVAGVDGPLWWIGVIRFALLVVWVYYIPSASPAIFNSSPLSLRTIAMTPVFDFYRTQLERRRDYFQDGYRMQLQSVLLGAGFILYSIAYPRLFLVFGIPIAIGSALLYKRRNCELPEIKREIEALNRFEKD